MKLTKKKKFDLIDLFAHTIMILFSAVVLYPMLNVIAGSFSSAGPLTRDEVTIFPIEFTLKSYEYVLARQDIVRAFGNSLLYTACGVACNLIATAVMAYPLSKSKLIGRSWIMKLATFTMYFGGGMIPTYMLVYKVGLMDSMWSLILPNLIWTMDLIICINGYRAIHDSLYEAAYLDGATEFQVFYRIALPLTKATLASIGLFFFMGHWNSFFIPMLYLDTPTKYPLQVLLRSLMIEDSIFSGNQSDTQMGTALSDISIKNAIVVVTMVPVMIVYPMVQKHFVGGVMIGSVKG